MFKLLAASALALATVAPVSAQVARGNVSPRPTALQVCLSHAATVRQQERKTLGQRQADLRWLARVDRCRQQFDPSWQAPLPLR